MNNKWTKTVLTLLVITLLGVVFYNKVYIPKTTYQTFTPTVGVMNETVFGIGEVDAKEIYPLTAQTGGKIIFLGKDQGDWVKKGELIAKIDPVDLPPLIESAKIALDKAKLQIKVTQDAQDALDARLKLAKVTYNRTLALYKKKFASKSEYDKAKSDYDTLIAQLRSAKVQISTAKIEAQRAEKNLEALEEKNARLTILSPIDGYVISRNAQLSQTILPSQPIVTLVDPKTVWVRINIDEHISGKVAVGQKATITLRSHPKTPFVGKVARIEAQSDALTEERVVDVAFDQLPRPFYLKERAEASIDTAHFAKAVKIPLKLLVQEKGKTGVWIAQDGKAHFQIVEIIATDTSFAAVKGVNKQATILLLSFDKKPLSEGARVHL